MRHKKIQARKLIFWALIVFGTSFCFFWARDAALAARGYAAIGGEWLLWLLPGVLWAYLRTGGEMREEWKDEEPREAGGISAGVLRSEPGEDSGV